MGKTNIKLEFRPNKILTNIKVKKLEMLAKPLKHTRDISCTRHTA